MSTRVSYGKRLTFLLLSIPLLTAVGGFIYLPISDPEFRTFWSIVTSIVVVIVFGLLGAVALANAFHSHSPVFGPMPTRRFVRLLLASGMYGLVLAALFDGLRWLERRSFLLHLLGIVILVIVWQVAGVRIRRGMRWLSLGESAPPEKTAS